MERTEQESIYLRTYKKSYENERRKILESTIKPYNKKSLLDYHTFLFAKGCKDKRITKVSYQMRYLFSLNTKVLLTWTKDDIEFIISHINQRDDITLTTKADYRIIIKQFFRWFKKVDPRFENGNPNEQKDAIKMYEYIFEDVRTSLKRENILREEILEDDDLKVVLLKGFEGVNHSQRDKAYLSLLHESGMRAGEILTMKIKSIKHEDKSAIVSIHGKTGVRNIRVVASIPYLYSWLNVHPFRNDPEKPLWVGLRYRNKIKLLTYPSAKEIIDQAFTRAGIGKRHNHHWFRHSRATILADYLTETDLCNYMGWRIGSRVVSTYVHSNNKRTNDKISEMHGLITKESLEPKTTPKICPICKKQNEAIAEFCCQCGHYLDLKAALKYDDVMKDETNKTIQLLMEIMKNPELLAAFEKFKQERSG